MYKQMQDQAPFLRTLVRNITIVIVDTMMYSTA